jgi:phosphatidate cytidylyltransferase
MVNPAPAPRLSESRLRFLSAIALAPFALGAVYVGGAFYAGFVALATAAGLYEWLRLVDTNAPKIEMACMYIALVLALTLAAVGLGNLSFAGVALAAAVLYAYRSDASPSTAFWFALGLPYMAGSGAALIYLRSGITGFLTLIYLLAIVWSMDSGAYFFGRAIGGPKLAPTLSPKKTWAGFIGGLITSVVAAWVVMYVTHARFLVFGLVLAMLLAAVAQIGDLFKSYFKRRAGVKDTGALIPGHGGVLDRIDGLVFAAMALAALQSLVGNRIIW